MTLKNMWSPIRHLFSSMFLPSCLCCGDAASGRSNLCAGCEADLPRAPSTSCSVCARPDTAGTVCGRCAVRPPNYSRTVAALLYAGASIHLVHAYKFGGDLAAGAALAALLLDAVRDETDPDVLIPVPLSRTRQRARGFDQSLELARLIGRARSIPLRMRGIARQRDCVPQSTLSGWDQRWRNVRDAFHVKPGSVAGLTVVVVDDVMTSGATAQALSGALLAAGAARVHLWVACRAASSRASERR